MSDVEEALKKQLLDPSLNEDQREWIRSFLAKDTSLNILFVGPTGSGKSSTINALFDIDSAKVGTSAYPQTKELLSYTKGELTIWDSPGLGDGVLEDEAHAKKIRQKLLELDEYKEPLIDLVVLIISCSSRDLGSAYSLISKVIAPCLELGSRLIIALNKADLAIDGSFKQRWDKSSNTPSEASLKALHNIAVAIKQRVNESLGVDLQPIFYRAGRTDKNGVQQKPYNVAKLQNYIISHTSLKKRRILKDTINQDEDIHIYNDANKSQIDELAKLKAEQEKRLREQKEKMEKARAKAKTQKELARIQDRLKELDLKDQYAKDFMQRERDFQLQIDALGGYKNSQDKLFSLKSLHDFLDKLK